MIPLEDSRRPRPASLWGAIGLLSMAVMGCGGDATSPGAPDARPAPPGAIDAQAPVDCRTPDEFFEAEVWPRIVEPICSTCHVDGGAAAESTFVLVTPLEDADYLVTNYGVTRGIAEMRVPSAGGRSLLELMPTNTLEHGGAIAVMPEGDLHGVLLDFIARVDGVPCDPTMEPPPTVPFFQGVQFAVPLDLLRRVTLSLAGRLPTDEEIERVEDTGMPAIDPILDAIMREIGFRDRVIEGFADIFLTHGYDASNEQILSWRHFPSRGWIRAEPYASLPNEIRWRMGDDYDDALRREPLELIAHIVMNDRPFTQVLTADYMMVSPYTARGYGIYEDVVGLFTDPDDPFEFVEAQLPTLTDRTGRMEPSETGYYPHAGVLGTFQYLHRYPSTDTNRNRARARMFFQHFLGVDIMASAPAVTDAAAVTARYANPTMEAPDCVSCHRVIDPIAGLFRDFNNKGEFERDDAWFDDMFAPGWGAEGIPAADRWRSLQWLAEWAADDDRFPIAMVEHVYYILTQERVLLAPSESDSHFAARRRGYDAQRAMIVEAARAFRGSGYNLKEAFRSIIHADFYRAVSYEGALTDRGREVELGVLGLGALLTPEQLRRKIRAIFGPEVDLPLGGANYDLYGGIDYRAVTERPTTPNGAMGALMRLMASSVSCSEVSRGLVDEGRGPHDLFAHVDATTLDETLVRQNLVLLHGVILGQRLTPDAADIDRSYRLFERVVREGAARVAAGEELSRLLWDCRHFLPTEPDDTSYVIRGWQAVVTYLLRRPEVLLQ